MTFSLEVRVDTDIKKHYREKGYIVLKNVVPLEYINDLYQVVVSVLSKHCPNVPDFNNKEPWSDPLFHESMLRFRTEQPQLFGYLFDTVQTSVPLWRLGTERTLCDIAAELMDDTVTGLSITDLLLRMDAPRDTRNKLEWHQDSSYFRQNERGENGCVCSITMRDLTHEHGPLEILPGSHTLGRIDVQSTGKNDAVTSEQFRVPADFVERFTPEKTLLNAGDAIFFNFDLIHRSGFNASNFFRFTAIARYHRMLTEDFKAGRLVYRDRALASSPTT
jgi:ectoine hydroxylase-related dioxygenase (phytanoyl-CoA dioxygenase family)